MHLTCYGYGCDPVVAREWYPQGWVPTLNFHGGQRAWLVRAASLQSKCANDLFEALWSSGSGAAYKHSYLLKNRLRRLQF